MLYLLKVLDLTGWFNYSRECDILLICHLGIELCKKLEVCNAIGKTSLYIHREATKEVNMCGTCFEVNEILNLIFSIVKV